MSEIIIGIDLGTTNSEVAVVENGQTTVIGDESTKIVPSVVGIAEDGSVLVGEAARNQYALYPERTIKSIKRRMGTDQSVEMAGKEYQPQEISAIILKHLKTQAEQYLGQSVSKAVITVPAYFNDAQRQATKEAGVIAGLEVMRIINEPTSAALSYDITHHQRQNVLVYDLGGGTFDVSAVKMEDDIVEVVATHGNNQLGGDDFDQKIIDHIVYQFNTENSIDVTTSLKSMARITRAAEQAKCLLSSQPYVTIAEEYLYEKDGQPIHLNLELSRLDYENLITDYVEETLESVHIALKDAGLTVSDIDQILLVGGSTRTPLVRERLEELFDKQPRGDINPDLCVAMGAAVQGAMIAGLDVSAILVDVTPYTFGTSAAGMLDGIPTFDRYVPIIHKNSPIPLTKSEAFQTMHDSQESVEVRVFQGENPLASENIEIGSFHVEGLSKVPAGNIVVLQFAMDLNGVLEVTAKEKKTGLEKSIAIDNAISRFEGQQMDEAKQRIGEMFDGITDIEQKASAYNSESSQQHRVVQAKALVEKAERIMDNASPEDKEDMVNMIESINDAIANNNTESLTASMEELSDIMYYLES